MTAALGYVLALVGWWFTGFHIGRLVEQRRQLRRLRRTIATMLPPSVRN
jgi:hypothetical protein